MHLFGRSPSHHRASTWPRRDRAAVAAADALVAGSLLPPTLTSGTALSATASVRGRFLPRPEGADVRPTARVRRFIRLGTLGLVVALWAATAGPGAPLGFTTRASAASLPSAGCPLRHLRRRHRLQHLLVPGDPHRPLPVQRGDRQPGEGRSAAHTEHNHQRLVGDGAGDDPSGPVRHHRHGVLRLPRLGPELALRRVVDQGLVRRVRHRRRRRRQPLQSEQAADRSVRARAEPGSDQPGAASRRHGLRHRRAVPQRWTTAPRRPRASCLPDTTAGIGTKPTRALKDDVIYEVHVRGLTENDPTIPAADRGTYKGAGLKAACLAASA